MSREDNKNSEQTREFKTNFLTFTLPEDVIAIKSIVVSKVNPEDTPTTIKFNFDMEHCHGELSAKLSSSEFWLEGGNDEFNDEMNIFVVSYELTNYSLVESHKFKNIHEVLKNSIQGKHHIDIEMQDENDKQK